MRRGDLEMRITGAGGVKTGKLTTQQHQPSERELRPSASLVIREGICENYMLANSHLLPLLTPVFATANL